MIDYEAPGDTFAPMYPSNGEALRMPRAAVLDLLQRVQKRHGHTMVKCLLAAVGAASAADIPEDRLVHIYNAASLIV